MFGKVAGAAALTLGIFIWGGHASLRADPLTCTISSGGFALSDYDVFSPSDNTTILSDAVSYTCNKDFTAVEITLGPSVGTTMYAPREMLLNSTDPLLYYISLGGFTAQCGGGSGLVWGDFALSNSTVSYVAVTGRRNLPKYVTAYGCIPHGQNVFGGLHTDALTVTVSF